MRSPRTSGNFRGGKKPGPKRGHNRAGRPPPHELELRKRKIIDVASSMFLARGYTETTVLDIARQAGVATRTLSEHFGDKEQLFGTVVALGSTALVKSLSIDENLDVRAALIACARHLHATLSTEQLVGQVRLLVAESVRFPDTVGDAGATLFHRYVAEISAVLSCLAARKLIATSDNEQSAKDFFDLIVGSKLVMTICGPPKPTVSDEEIEWRVDLFLRGWFGQ